jgi:SAM-dependent methyltransferase
MAAGEACNDYATLAPHYDAVYNAFKGNRSEEIEVVSTLVDHFHSDVQSLLDLGTGTGAILTGFKGKIPKLVGLDISEAMLDAARTNLPEADFVLADMSDFDLGIRFDAAICLFDAINHLRSFDQWERLFEKTAEHLNPGGVFIFDMITTGYVHKESVDPKPICWKIPSGSYSYQAELDRADNNSYVGTYVLELDGENFLPKIITGKVYETTFPVEDVKAAAARHFELLFSFDSIPSIVRDDKFVAVSDESARPMFVYRKLKEPTTT